MSATRLHGLGLVLLLAHAPLARATHVPDLTADEEKCQQALAGALGKFGAAKTKCLVKCDKGAAKGKNPEADCLSPFGGKTADCVAAAEEKAGAAVAKKCAADCPECYAGGDCTAHTASQLAAAEFAVDLGAAIVRCDDSSSTDGLTAAERKCRQAAATQAGKLVSTYGKCLAKCRAGEQKGKLPPGTCTPGTITDPKTTACIDKVFAACVLNAEKKCPDPPECLDDVFFLCQGITGVVEGFDPAVFCGSPGGAFLDGAR
jgi:hypothetical protein